MSSATNRAFCLGLDVLKHLKDAKKHSNDWNLPKTNENQEDLSLFRKGN